MQFISVHLIILIIVQSTLLQAYTPAGYIGCFEDHRRPRRTLNGEKFNSVHNSGDSCKQYCSGKGYRYAGTEVGVECHCGHTIRERKRANNCNSICFGNYEEFCGGHWRISIYDTWHCAIHPCKNGATCRDLRSDRYTCICTYEWTGKHCEIRKQTTTLKPTTKLKPSTTSTKRSTSTTSTTRSVKSTKTRSGVTYKSSATYVQTTDGKNHQRSKSIRATTAESPNKTATDDTSSSMIPLYVILPLGLIILLTLSAVFLKRRCRQKKEATIENLSHGTGSVPNIYANITVSNLNRSEQNKTSSISSENTVVMMGNKLRTCVDKERNSYVKQETDDYNTIALRSNTGLVHKHSYDHVAKTTDSVDRSYSHISTMQLNNKHTNVNNTYSHFSKVSGQNCLYGFAENTNDTYNVLELRDNPQRVKCCNKTDEFSEYDHADKTVTKKIEEDNYSHLNTTTLHVNTNCESNNYLDENYITMKLSTLQFKKLSKDSKYIYQ